VNSTTGTDTKQGKKGDSLMDIIGGAAKQTDAPKAPPKAAPGAPPPAAKPAPKKK
jgi:hypothetical protein